MANKKGNKPTQMKTSLATKLFLVVAAAIVLHIALYVRLWGAAYDHPAIQGVDFIIFYTAGQIAHDEGFDQVYNLEAQRAIQRDIVGEDFVPGGVLPFNHPPFLLPLLWLIIDDDYHASYARWCGVLLLMMAGCGFVAGRLLLARGWSRQQAVLVAASSVLFFPLFIALLAGQDIAFVLLGALLWLWGHLEGRARLAGIGLALTLIKPHLALPLVVPLVVTWRKEARWFLLASLALMAYSFLLVGWQGWLDFFNLIEITAKGGGFGVKQDMMFNFTGLVLRSVPTLPPELMQSITWGMYGLTIALLCWLWWIRRAHMMTPHYLVLIMLLIIFYAPHLYYHDLALLLPPALIITLLLAEQNDGRAKAGAVVLVAACSLLLLVGSLVGNELQPLVVYGMMLTFAMGIYKL
jgi:hypothetical protein